MTLGHEVAEDYANLRLSLRAHPLALLRPFLPRRTLRAEQLAGIEDGRWVEVAGLTLVRQRPGTASGVIFITLEDETGVANLVVWPKVFERFRRTVLGAQLLAVQGKAAKRRPRDPRGRRAPASTAPTCSAAWPRPSRPSSHRSPAPTTPGAATRPTRATRSGGRATSTTSAPTRTSTKASSSRPKPGPQRGRAHSTRAPPASNPATSVRLEPLPLSSTRHLGPHANQRPGRSPVRLPGSSNTGRFFIVGFASSSAI